MGGPDGHVPRPAAWPSGLGKGLQSPVHRFDSGRRLVTKVQVGDTLCTRVRDGEFFRAARDVGNLQAASRGPTPYAKRVIRRTLLRKSNGELRLVRGLGV